MAQEPGINTDEKRTDLEKIVVLYTSRKQLAQEQTDTGKRAYLGHGRQLVG